MKIDFRNVRTRWINVDKDTNKANLMVEMLDTLGFKNHDFLPSPTSNHMKVFEKVRSIIIAVQNHTSRFLVKPSSKMASLFDFGR